MSGMIDIETPAGVYTLVRNTGGVNGYAGAGWEVRLPESGQEWHRRRKWMSTPTGRDRKFRTREAAERAIRKHAAERVAS